MKKIILSFFLLVFCLGFVSADIRRDVVTLLSSLIKQYAQSREDIYLKRPLAVLPFIESGELARKHNLGAVMEELIRNEVVNSTAFILTERKNMDRIIEEIEFSLSDLASSENALRIGSLTGAAYFIAGSITEAGDAFLLNARLIDVETAVVIGAETVAMEKSELIGESRSSRYSYVFRYGLGFSGGTTTDILIAGAPPHIESAPLLVDVHAGVFYRPWNFLQLSVASHTAWTEFQFGPFDPASPDYDNSEVLKSYYEITGLSNTDLPHCNVEYNQYYLDLQVFFVFNPIKRLTVSAGGGGLLGFWNARLELTNFPVYVGEYGFDEQPAEPDLEESYRRENIVMTSGNGLLTGVIGAFKVEYYISPRVLLSAGVLYKKTFGSDPYGFELGGVNIASDEDDAAFAASKWIPGKTPYGDSLSLELDSISVDLGVAISF
ncbi:MAG: hypothetical protein JW881_15015 [Spirochaetales bacterium]|nr:hypothetical protein [Spirochaetales bacterium]